MFNTPLDKLLRKIMLIGIPLALIWFYLFTPTYPVPSEVNSKEAISQYIKKIYKLEARNLQFEYQDKGGIPVEALQSVQRSMGEFKQCNFEKECMIEVYEDHMDEWTSDNLRVMTRAEYMTRKFGIIGDMINKFMGFLY